MQLADRLNELWQSVDGRPDVFAFLQQHDGSDGAEVLAAVLTDQRHRWKTEQPLKVEEYLQCLPALAGDPDVQLELAVGEFQARQDSSSTPSVEELATRFPDISDTLRSRLATSAPDSHSGKLSDHSALQTYIPTSPSGDDKQNTAPPLPDIDDALQSKLESSASGSVPGELDDNSVLETYVSDSTVGDEQLGRYLLRRVLGEGAFGRVYLGFDDELQRQVAIKVPTEERFRKPEDAEQYLEEARTVASLDHPHIVPVHDVGRTEEGSIYVVSKYIEGGTLAERTRETRLTHEDAARLVATVALGLHHAHEKRLIHRDVKPGNILLEESTGTPYVADFGLAIREEDFLRDGRIAGTPAYMSPEQARGEGHRLDGRSDLFSLGIILYELLTGSIPFRGSSASEYLHKITTEEPRPPREADSSIPIELERICLKALQKRASDRYSTAAEMAHDLEHWNDALSEKEQSDVPVVPRGLRSFDADDADFFLDLLPGPRNRHGLPESIQFWKTRLEETDPEQTFAVGLIYGPSGCGKSSLVKAGLLPRLSREVTALYIEATPDDTETRILRGLRKLRPELPADAGLLDTFTQLRRSECGKVVVILDQFEQWLHAHGTEQDTELVAALRQCDGGNLQAVVMVRDDFAMAASRFMRELESRIVEGHNFATVDLFDIDHAEKVLIKFGRAFGRAAAIGQKPASDEREFTAAVASGLAQDGKVVSVRLALFAEMVKGKPWALQTLREVGGTEGVGVNFLEETFSSREANPEHRLHQQAARQVLQALLPEVGSDIKGHMRSHAELLELSGYRDRPRDFAELLRILDGELRLITPTDPAGVETQSGSSDPAAKYYQLTHDYLVPSLREWLTRKQQETRKGRAELKLAERSALWNAKPENRHLPSLLEWARIRTLTEKDNWTEPQWAMMLTAGRMHILRTTAVASLLVILSVAGFAIRNAVNDRQRELLAQQTAARNEAESSRLVEGLLTAKTSQVAGSISNLKDFREWANPLLQAEYQSADSASDARLHTALALVADTDQPDMKVLEFLTERLLTVKPAQFGPVRELLQPHQDTLVPVYWNLALNDEEAASRRFHAACALAAFDPDNERVPAANGQQVCGWNAPEFTTFVSEQLISVEPVYVGLYQQLLRPVSSDLVPSLSAVLSDPERGELAKTLATSLLADYAVDQPDTLTDLVLVAEPAADLTLFPVLEPHRAAAIPQLHALLDERLLPDWQDQPLDPDWTEPSADIRARIETAHGQIAERSAFCQDMPWPVFLDVVESLRAFGYRPTRIRLHADEGLAVTVAAVWTRDARSWQLQHGVTPDQLPFPDQPAEQDGLIPEDVAATPADDVEAEPEFLILWAEPHADGEQRRILADVSETELQSAAASLAKQGFAAQCTISVRNDASGARRYSGIWSNTGAPSELRPAYPGFELVWQPQWDVAVAEAAPLSDPLEQYRQQLTQIAQLPAERQEEPGVRQARATANYQLGNLDEAWTDLKVLQEQGMSSATVQQYAALTLARLGRTEEATEALDQHLATEPPASFQSYLKVLVPAWLGDAEAASAELDTAVEVLSDDLYNVACAAALCAQAFADGDAARSGDFADRSVSLLEQMVGNGYDDAEQLRDDSDFRFLHDDPRFVALLEQLRPPARVAAVWRADVEFESRLLTGASPAELLSECTPLLDDGWRPFAIARDSTATPVEATNSAGTAVCFLIAHRPVIPDAVKEALAIRQAAAATTLLRLDAADRVWPLLQDQPDPRLRSYLLHRLAQYEVDPQSLLDQLAMESDVSRQRSLIQGLGEFARAGLLSEKQQVFATEKLSLRYAEDPDPGIHGMCEWTLRQLGADASIAEVRSAYATGTPVGERQWYLTNEGQHTLMIVDGNEEFLMGSPVSEAERYGGPTGRNEIRHRRQIGRTFAIASHEVTVAQFQAFRTDHDFDRSIARELNAPADMISWYDAAAYCNWLSEQEGLDRDQWCYDPDQSFEEGMTLLPDYLERTGYRLPSEAEWEYACRAGTTTARYYGETTALLDEYAWYTKTSGDQWMLPVGSLRPNGLGLFEMLGNVMEWCQEAGRDYDTDVPAVGDSEQLRKLDNSGFRVQRSGSYNDFAPNVRSASRYATSPKARTIYNGFRVARTYD